MGTREQLISAAADLVDAGGPAAVTLREVAARVGMSHNAPYKHFADKEELLAAVASRELRRPSETPLPGDATDPVSQLRARAKAYVRWARRYPERFKLVFGTWRTAYAELGDAADASRQALVSLMSAAQAQGMAPAGDPQRLTALMLALAHGAADLALGGYLARDGKGAADPEDLLDDLFLLLARSA